MSNQKPSKMSQHMKSPCAQCPFRKDSLKGWLGKDRMREMTQSESFVCHKTTKGAISERKQCAGHMILMDYNNEFVRVADSFNVNLGLQNKELIFDSHEDCINHHTTKTMINPITQISSHLNGNNFIKAANGGKEIYIQYDNETEYTEVVLPVIKKELGNTFEVSQESGLLFFADFVFYRGLQQVDVFN